MGKEIRGKRTGTGPYKKSWQRRQTKEKGKRLLNGEKCPIKFPVISFAISKSKGIKIYTRRLK